MPLKTFVKVGSITNLSDARYCSGMGVDMLGFRVVEGQENHLKSSQFQEIRGWIAGPLIVAEIYGLDDPKELPGIIENYKPDYLEMSVKELSKFSALPLPFLLAVEENDVLAGFQLRPAYFISKKPIKALKPLLVEVLAKGDVQPLLDSHNVQGIALRGGVEIKPGLKDYEVLNEVLELLEVE